MIGRTDILKPTSRSCLACTEFGNALGGGHTWFGIDGEHVALGCAHLKRTLRGAAKHDQWMWRLQGAHIGVGAANPIEPTLEVEWRVRCPGAFHKMQILPRPLIALGLGCKIAVAFLFGVSLAGDHVQRDTAAHQLVEGCDLASEQGGRHEARPMSDQI
jgi:hypothetical protein